jgi:hypothetical protein
MQPGQDPSSTEAGLRASLQGLGGRPLAGAERAVSTEVSSRAPLGGFVSTLESTDFRLHVGSQHLLPPAVTPFPNMGRAVRLSEGNYNESTETTLWL